MPILDDFSFLSEKKSIAYYHLYFRPHPNVTVHYEEYFETKFNQRVDTYPFLAPSQVVTLDYVALEDSVVDFTPPTKH